MTIEAMIRAILSSKETKTTLKSEVKLLHKSLKTLPNNKSYIVFLIGKEPRKHRSEEEVIYYVTVRDSKCFDDTYDLNLSEKLIRQIFD